MTRVVSILGGEKELGKKIQNPIDFDSLIKKECLRPPYTMSKRPLASLTRRLQGLLA